MAIKLFDIGANLSNRAFNKDYDTVIERAQEAGIQKIAITGTDLNSSEQAIALCEQNPDLFLCTAGIHPHDAKSFTRSSSEQLRAFASEPVVKAIGETGLDFNRNYSDPADQVYAFEQQLELACELGMPLFIHERDADKKLYEILTTYRDQITQAVVHCFTGSREALYSYLDLDLHIGITGWICDERRGEHLKTLVPNIPTNRLMIETDAPYLLPRNITKPPYPAEKRRNEPCTLVHVLAAVAACTNKPAKVVEEETWNTSMQFFGLESD